MAQDVGGGSGEAASKLDPMSWVEAHGDALFRFALLRVKDRQVAEELVQETFLAALAGKERYAGRASERTWLVGILKFKVIDHFRRGPRDMSLQEDAEDGTIAEWFRSDGHWKKSPDAWGVDASALLERAEFWAVFEDCLRGLPERTGRAFALRVIDGTEADLVCKALAISPTNLWALLHRARARLRRCLEVKWFAEGRERA